LFQQAHTASRVHLTVTTSTIIGRASDGRHPVVPAVIEASVSVQRTVAFGVATIAVTPARLPVVASAPLDIEGVAFTPRFRILDPYHGNSTIASGIAGQLLASPPVHSTETEVGHIAGQSSGTSHPSPLRRLSLFGDETTLVSGNLDQRYLIDGYLNRAFSGGAVSTSDGGAHSPDVCGRSQATSRYCDRKLQQACIHVGLPSLA
jgi:hypothetical protein